jgi:phenylalanyl-tRNA synthetase alpha chain
MVRHLFGEDRTFALRPSYFPFTEPSVEVDVSYIKKDGSIGYIEILGAGQVHPNVLKWVDTIQKNSRICFWYWC